MDLNRLFRQESPLTTTPRKVLEYLGMTLDYTTKGKVKISMQEYLYKMLAELPSDMKGVSKTPMALHLFKTDEGAKKLRAESAAASSPRGKTSLSMPKDAARHTDCRGFFEY